MGVIIAPPKVDIYLPTLGTYLAYLEGMGGLKELYHGSLFSLSRIEYQTYAYY